MGIPLFIRPSDRFLSLVMGSSRIAKMREKSAKSTRKVP